MKTLLSLALVLAYLHTEAATFIRRTYFSSGNGSVNEGGPDVPVIPPPSECLTSNLFLNIPYKSTPNNINWNDGAFICQKISNSSPVAITVKMFSFQAKTNASDPPAVFTAYVRDNPNFLLGTTYGSGSVSTNQSRDGVYMDFNWTAGTEPVVPAMTDFYIGAVIQGTATKQHVSLSGNYYLGTNYCSFNAGGPMPNSDFYLDIYICP